MDDFKKILKKYWGYDDFRGIQREIIESILAGHDTLGLMPTGGGKSITFQVPALAQEGTCIVITPLIALMKDQVQHLRSRGIKAAAIYTGLSHDQILQTLENAVFGAVKLLYVSPERLSSELFRQKVRHMKVCFICVDEAHCISQWGYDFRPSYLAIADIRSLVPDVPVLALTATATPEVVDDIQDRLHFREKCVFRMGFERKNLAYVVRPTINKEQQLIHILQRVPGSAIVYVRSRQRTKEYADLLCKMGIKATFFHAGLDNSVKDQRQHEWQQDHVRVMVATNAFGMGIDKPDVRVVVHIDCPDSIEAYFQEAGRAGRDGQKAYAVLLYEENDKMKLRKRIADTFPDKDYIREIYDQLAYFYQVAVGSGYNATFEFPVERFCQTYRHFPIPTISALNILTRAGYIDFRDEDEAQARVMFLLGRDDLYRLRDNEPQEDAVIVALLRTYTGLFQDYAYIDEGIIAQQCNLTPQQVYAILISLSQKRILSFIPQKHIPFIRYSQRREDSRHLVFPHDVYDDLKARYTQRIEKMIEYATSHLVCRSRLLLRYFGETRSDDCGMCDVCLRNGDEE
jgi:ATP-dependent DNA helicase RecQ